MDKLKLARIKIFRGISLIVVFCILLFLSSDWGIGYVLLCFLIFLVSIGFGIMLTIQDAKAYIKLRDDIKFERNFDNALARFSSIPPVTSHYPSGNLTKQLIWDSTTCHLFQNPSDYLNYKRYEIKTSTPAGHSLTETGIFDLMCQMINEAITVQVWEYKGLISFNHCNPIPLNDILEVNIESNQVSIQRGNAYTSTNGISWCATTYEKDKIQTIYHVMVSVKDIHHPLYDLDFGCHKHNAYEVYSLLKALQN